jgi:GT2 family glycosyltransferase
MENICSVFKDGHTGAAGSVIYNSNGVVMPPVIRERCFGEFLERLDLDSGPREVAYANEAGLVYRKNLRPLAKVDEGLIGDGFGESIMICCKIRKAGYKIIGVPNAILLHFPQSSGGKMRFFKDKTDNLFYFFSNRVYLRLTYQNKSILDHCFFILERFIMAIRQGYNYRSPFAIIFSIKGIFNGIRLSIKYRE